MNCWICGNEGKTGEHRIKASDLRSFFGEFTQKSPLYFHTSEKRNIPVGSIKSDRFKSKAKICNKCNSSITQPYDKAWEKLSTYLRGNFCQISKTGKINLSKVFPGATKQAMLNVHLYFVKLFGCFIVEHDVPIEITPFANAIKTRLPHMDVYLAFGPRLGSVKNKFAGVTPIDAVNKDGRVVFASWFYIVGDIAVDVIYSAENEYMQVIRNFWHPCQAGKILRLSHFKHNFSIQEVLRNKVAPHS